MAPWGALAARGRLPAEMGIGSMARRIFLGLLVLLILAAAATLYLRRVDRYQAEGTLRLPILERPVRVVRDEQGIPYIFAESLDDAVRAQGFVTAQDRLFQIDFERYLSSGRLAELVGESALDGDIQIRLAGLARHGARHAALLGPADRRFYELYLEGLNAYIRDHADEHQFGFELLGTHPEPWTLADLMTLLYFLNWTSAVNVQAELLTQELIERLGPERAAQIRQVTINPDDGSGTGLRPATPARELAAIGLRVGPGWMGTGPQPLEVGSNQWVMSGRRSTSGAPVVVNDPHLDARTLPGIWHPVGLITPGFRAVGVAGPGVPGLAAGRTTHIAFGITNAYGDVIDLFVETQDPADPGRYLEGDRSYAFEVTHEVVRVRARPGSSAFREVPLTIRHTHRGAVISDHGMVSVPGKLVSMRWSAPEAMAPDTGAFALFTARSVAEARAALGRSTAPYNYVIADQAGNIGHVTAGRVPIRRRGDGSVPLPVTDGEDAWAGFIPAGDMPGVINPARGWVGNANHRTVPADYPYDYSTYFAASWRYRRMLELLDGPAPLSPEQHWKFVRDTGNTMAERVVPTMSRALLADRDAGVRQLGHMLAGWDFHDDPDAVAPAVFQSVYRQFARRVFQDELGPELTERYLSLWYYWQERLVLLLADPESAWFDDQTTPEQESRDDLYRLAARDAQAQLAEILGPDPATWTWGRLHTVTFFSPLLPGTLAARFLGAGTHPKEGSGETINRATYKFDQPFDATSIASLRFVADLGDPDKILAVLVGGASGRQFSPNLSNQTRAWLSGEPRYWWFSDDAIRAHQQKELILMP